MNFGQYLKYLREDQGLTLTRLEQMTDISNAYLSQLERGIKTNPSADVIFKLSKVLGADFLQLMHVAGYDVDIDRVPKPISLIYPHVDWLFKAIFYDRKELIPGDDLEKITDFFLKTIFIRIYEKRNGKEYISADVSEIIGKHFDKAEQHLIGHLTRKDCKEIIDTVLQGNEVT